MSRTLIRDTVTKVGEPVTIRGWVNTRRDHGKIVFIDVRDRSGILQVVGEKLTKAASNESVVEITGIIKSRPENLVNSKLITGAVEMEAQELVVISKAEELPLDISAVDLNLELPTLLDYRSLTLRHPKVKAIFKVQEVIIDSFRNFLKSQEFVEFQAPNIIPSIPEGGAEVFTVKYFDHQAYLSQSPQLYKSLLVSIFERVFSVNKVFRAEPSVTTRHLTEVVSLDAEMGFINDYQEVMDMAEKTIKYIFNDVSLKCGAELELLNATIPAVSEKIPHVTLTEALEIIFKRTGRDHRLEKDLDPEDEREICRWSHQEHGCELVFVSHYFTKKKPFYTYADQQNPEYNEGFDLIGRGVEWLSGGRRVHDYQELLSRVNEWGMDPKKMEIYLQAFRYGMPPLGGFAFGAERITMNMLGVKNIREVSMFPRDMERVDVRLSTIKSSKDTYQQLLQLIKDINFTQYQHQPVFTSQQAADSRPDISLHQGAKSLVLTDGNRHYMYVVAGDSRADLQSLATILGVKKLSLVPKDDIESVTGLVPGSIPPFGSLFSMPTYIDPSLMDNQEIIFNAGRLDKSIKISLDDFINLEKPQIIKS